MARGITKCPSEGILTLGRRSALPGERYRARWLSWPNLAGDLLFNIVIVKVMTPRVMFRHLVEQDHVEQRLMHLDSAVVCDKDEFAKPVHKEAYARAGGADHLSQGLLRNRRDESFVYTGLSKFSHD